MNNDLPRSRTVTAARPELEQHSLSVAAIWSALRKHWSVTLMVALFVMLAVAFYTLGQTKIYRASASIQIDPSAPRPLGKEVQTVVDMGAGDYFANREYLETQFKIIQSKRVALSVVERLGLHNDPSFVANTLPRPDLPGKPVSEELATEVLRSRLTVEPVKESRLAFVRFEDASPERAQRILATLMDAYINQNLDDNLASVNSAVDWLRVQLDKLKGDLDTSEMALHEFKQQQNVLALEVDDQSNILKEELRQLSMALTTVRTKREELSAKRGELMKIAADDPRVMAAPELLSGPLLPSLRQKYEDAVRERDEQLGRNKGKHHVDVQSAEGAVTAARAAVLAEVKNVQGAAKHELSAAQRQEAGLLALLSEAQRRAVEVNLLEMQYAGLKRSRANNDKLYSMVLERTKETDLQRLLRVNNIRVVDGADLPHVPVRPRVPLMILLALIAGLGSGLGVAVALVALDRTIKTPEDIEGELGITCLGLLPMLAPRGRGGYYGRRRRPHAIALEKITPELVVHEAPTSNVAEAARAVRTNLMFMSPDNPIRALLVTSANPGEGKTTVACAIAIAIAHAGHRTLLVDCDLRRPRIHRIFGKTSDVGLTTALLGEMPLERVVQQTIVPNLTVLAAGPMPPNPADLMHSERFRALIAELRDSYDRVIIDSSPIAAVTDATILSAYVDATMLVVRAFTTKKDMARHALRAILDIGSKTAGVVLNAVDFSRHEYKYASYYGRYGYGTPYGAPGTEGAAPAPRPTEDDAPHRDEPSARA
jgi:capsular exopolysaccharide synthesis family protein